MYELDGEYGRVECAREERTLPCQISSVGSAFRLYLGKQRGYKIRVCRANGEHFSRRGRCPVGVHAFSADLHGAFRCSKQGEVGQTSNPVIRTCAQGSACWGIDNPCLNVISICPTTHIGSTIASGAGHAKRPVGSRLPCTCPIASGEDDDAQLAGPAFWSGRLTAAGARRT